jgi:integrase
MNFSDQSSAFLAQLSSSRRNPVKPATISTYTSIINNWITPLIGEEQLEGFGNGRMRAFVSALVGRGLAAKTVIEIVTLAKQIIASAVNEEGDPLFPRVWRDDYIDLPRIGKQKQPTVSDARMRAAMQDKHAVLWAFLAGTGLRIGEAQAVRIGDNGTSSAWIAKRAIVIVRTSIWSRKEQSPKTASAIREVDLHPDLNSLLIDYTSTRPTGSYLFCTRSGEPIWHANLRLRHLKPASVTFTPSGVSGPLDFARPACLKTSLSSGSGTQPTATSRIAIPRWPRTRHCASTGQSVQT